MNVIPSTLTDLFLSPVFNILQINTIGNVFKATKNSQAVLESQIWISQGKRVWSDNDLIECKNGYRDIVF